MKCRYVENNLIGYIENNLPQQTIQEIDLHLGECENCNILVGQVKNTYVVFDAEIVNEPSLFDGIIKKLLGHQTTVVEFIPQHKIIFRVAASVIVIIGIGLGVLLGGKYTSSQLTNIQTINNQYGLPEYYNAESASMDGESDLAVLYPND